MEFLSPAPLTCACLSTVTRLPGDMSMSSGHSASPSQTSPTEEVKTSAPMMHLCSFTAALPAHLPTHTCPAGFEAAHLFLKTREVPDVWKMDLSQILDSSSSDDDDEEKESEEEEEEEEDDDEKKKINKQMKDEVRECVRVVSWGRSQMLRCVCVSGGGGAGPRGEGPVPAAALQVHGGQRSAPRP